MQKVQTQMRRRGLRRLIWVYTFFKGPALFKIAAMAAILEIYFALHLQNRKANLLKTWQEVSGWLVDKKKQNLFWSEIQYGRHSRQLENLFWTSSEQ